LITPRLRTINAIQPKLDDVRNFAPKTILTAQEKNDKHSEKQNGKNGYRLNILDFHVAEA
jgi:hypothetical protein